jgi:hypothetical protein
MKVNEKFLVNMGHHTVGMVGMNDNGARKELFQYIQGGIYVSIFGFLITLLVWSYRVSNLSDANKFWAFVLCFMFCIGLFFVGMHRLWIDFKNWLEMCHRYKNVVSDITNTLNRFGITDTTNYDDALMKVGLTLQQYVDHIKSFRSVRGGYDGSNTELIKARAQFKLKTQLVWPLFGPDVDYNKFNWK